jgi:hypothetical protein
MANHAMKELVVQPLCGPLLKTPFVPYVTMWPGFKPPTYRTKLTISRTPMVFRTAKGSDEWDWLQTEYVSWSQKNLQFRQMQMKNFWGRPHKRILAVRSVRNIPLGCNILPGRVPSQPFRKFNRKNFRKARPSSGSDWMWRPAVRVVEVDKS